jgi:hypothetical protein
MSRNSQNMTVVLVYNTIAHENMAILVGIVYTPPKKFQPAVAINPRISIFCTIFLDNQFNSPNLRSIL